LFVVQSLGIEDEDEGDVSDDEVQDDDYDADNSYYAYEDADVDRVSNRYKDQLCMFNFAYSCLFLLSAF